MAKWLSDIELWKHKADVVVVIRGTAILAAVMFLTAIACGLWGVSREFASPWWAATVAASVCWTAGVLGLVCVRWCAVRWPAQGALAGTLVRMSIPLPVGLLLQKFGGELAESRVLAMILASYLVMLLTETLILLKGLPSVSARTPAAGVKST